MILRKQHPLSILTFLMIYTAFSVSMSGQNQLTNRQNARANQQNVATIAQKKAIVDQIVNKIAHAYDSLKVPRVHITPIGKGDLCTKVAYVDSKDSFLNIDEKLYDLCYTDFKVDADFKAALACFIAHEMSHFYAHKGINTNFFAHCDNGEGVESAADFYGFWYAQKAGYAIAKVYKKAYQLAYKGYNIDPNPTNKCYPTLANRCEIAKAQVKKADDVLKKLKQAKMLFLFEQYAEAVVLFEEVNRVILDNNVMNNLAVAKIHWVLSDMRRLPPTDNWRRFNYFVYPLEINALARIGQLRRGGRGGDMAANDLTKKLQEANDLLEKVTNKDIAWRLNKATVLILLGDVPNAIRQLDAIKSAKPSKKQADDAQILRGIAHFRNGNSDAAKKIFMAFADSKNCFDRYNACIARQFADINDITADNTCWAVANCTTSQGLVPCKIPEHPPLTDKEPCNVLNGIRYCRLKDSKGIYNIYAFSYDDVPLCDIKIGQPVSELPSQWQQKDRIIQTREGYIEYWYFESIKTVLEITHGKVSAWFIKNPTK